MFCSLHIRPGYWLALFAVTGFSCANFFMPVKQNTATTEATKKSIVSHLDNRYFILRQGEYNYALTDIMVDEVNLTLNAKVSAVDQRHLLYLTAIGRNYQYRPRKDSDKGVLREVHIYSKQTSLIDKTKVFSLPLDQIEKIEVIEQDKARTTTSYVLGGWGLALGTAVVAGIIVALTKSSCPFVSTYNGTQYIVKGELFGGAVNKSLERLDYVPLHMRAINGEYQLRISNELKEKQFTNFANLLVVEHDSSASIGVGTDGRMYQIAHCTTPVAASLNGNTDVLKAVEETDLNSCKFNDTSGSSAVNEVKLSFKNSSGAKNGKLVLQLKNSYWFDYLYGEFTSHFGSMYNKWHEEQNNRPAAEMIQWTNEQQIPLAVSIQTDTGWKEITKINTVGPLTNRQVVIPVTIDNKNNDAIEIKLSTGFMFWELDYAAMDFTEDLPIQIKILQPYYAVDENGNNLLSVLKEKDEQYLAQPEVGNYVTLKYKTDAPENKAKAYSVVLATSGYYEPVREYSGTPDLQFLKKFKEPGAMAAFSKDRYQFIVKTQSVIALKQN